MLRALSEDSIRRFMHVYSPRWPHIDALLLIASAGIYTIFGS